MKTCNKCKETLEYDKFAKNRSKSDGYENYCKPCKNTYNKSNYGDKFTKVSLLKNLMGASTEEKVISSVQHLEFGFAEAITKYQKKSKRKLPLSKEMVN
jgi:hypothetical protein